MGGEVVWKKFMVKPPIELTSYATLFPPSQGVLLTVYWLVGWTEGTVPTGIELPTLSALISGEATLLLRRETLIPPGDKILAGERSSDGMAGDMKKTRLQFLPCRSGRTSNTKTVDSVGESCAV